MATDDQTARPRDAEIAARAARAGPILAQTGACAAATYPPNCQKRAFEFPIPNQVRITAQLIETRNDKHLWSDTYDRDLTDIFAIQDEIANAIVEALRGSLDVAKGEQAVSVKAATDNVDAYDLYLQARELFIARRDLAQSVRLFEQAVALDPDFARGWEGLAAVSVVVEGWGIRDRDYMTLAVSAARRALALDESLSMPWAVLSLAGQRALPVDWEDVLIMADRAIAADGKNASALLWRSVAWTELGFFERALDDQKACLRVDPAYTNCERWQATSHLYMGHYDQALAIYERGFAKGFVLNRITDIVPLLLARGDRFNALLILNQLELPADLIAPLADALSPQPDPARVARARDMFKAAVEEGRASSVPSGPFSGLSGKYLWLGEFDLAVDSRSVIDDDILTWQPLPVAWRNSPDFKRWLRSMGVLGYWQKAGFPPQCHPLGEQDFECDPLPKP